MKIEINLNLKKIALFSIRLFLFSFVSAILLYIGEFVQSVKPELLIPYISVTVGTIVATGYALWEG